MAAPARKELISPWTIPTTETERPLPPLSIYNTFTRKKEKFVPLDKTGKKVTWYCCGPTVYDAAHLGHARNYVTTDVVRRIMRDYFGFDVHFVQNVTDVDDKIILRARQQHLLEEFKAKNPKLSKEVQDEASKAWHAYFTKQFGEANVTPASFQAWAEKTHEKLMALIAAEAAKKADEDTILDEKDTKTKMHLNTLLTAANAINKLPDTADELYSATSSVFLPYLDALNKGREYGTEVFAKLSSYWENHFNEDMATLNVLPPTTVTRVSEFIPENVSFVQKLVEKGFAYPTKDGSVYFDIAAYEGAGHSYAKLAPFSRGNEELMADGEGALSSTKASTLPNTVETKNDWPVEKKSKQDFALWKSSKPGEPSWESPWGFGRPGWHIECSVMCSEVLGGEVDIHSGGIDLAFPHHDNEIAQSEAYWDGCGTMKTVDGKHQWINYFMHMGHLAIHGSKMSKSLKNFVSVRDALQRGGWTSRSLRVVFLQGGWKDGIEVRKGVLDEAKNWETTVGKFFTNIKARIAEQAATEASGKSVSQPWTDLERELNAAYDQARTDVDRALCDSFDTPTAMKALLTLVGAANIYMSKTQSLALVKEVARWITRIITIFGLDTPADPIGFSSPSTGSSDGANAEEIATPYIRVTSNLRDQIRALAIAAPTEAKVLAKQLLALCDKVRDVDLADLGVALDDRDQGDGKPALIKFVPAEELRAAREEKERKAREKAEKQEAEKRKKAEEAKKKEEQAKIDPKTMFRTEEYSQWDEEGLPTHDKEGKELSGNAKKKVKKAYDVQKKKHDAWLVTQN